VRGAGDVDIENADGGCRVGVGGDGGLRVCTYTREGEGMPYSARFGTWTRIGRRGGPCDDLHAMNDDAVDCILLGAHVVEVWGLGRRAERQDMDSAQFWTFGPVSPL
jgi:hypothetical protein